MTLERGVLELDVDVDQDGTRETGVFHMVGNLEIQQRVEPDYVVFSGGGSTVNAVVGSAVDEAQNIITGKSTVEMKKRAGFWLDLGGGTHTFEVNFVGWEGAQDEDGNDLQWGTSATPGRQTENGTLVSATGEPPTTQMALLMEFLRLGEFDSRAEHARFQYGEYHDDEYTTLQGGEFEDYLHVTIQIGNGFRSAESPFTFDGSMTIVEVEDINRAIDGAGEIIW